MAGSARPVALITMATGYVGPALARTMAERGYDLDAGGRCALEWAPPAGRSGRGARCVAAAGDLLCAGFADGYVRVYDRRAGHWAAAAAEKVHDDCESWRKGIAHTAPLSWHKGIVHTIPCAGAKGWRTLPP